MTSVLPIPMRVELESYTAITAYDVYYWDNQSIYRITTNFDSSHNGKNILQEKRYQYFVFSKDSLFGLNFSMVINEHTALIQRFRVDSVKSTCSRAIEMDKAQSDIPADSIYTSASGELVYTYVFRKTAKYPEDFTFRYYYTAAFNGIPETFSKTYDTVKGMKLFKVEIAAHGAYYETEKFQMPPRIYRYQMDTI